jgi:NitT/TauT family transport system permease protein
MGSTSGTVVVSDDDWSGCFANPAGLKTAAVFSVVGAAVGKYLGGGQGLGELVRLSAQQLSLDRVFALIFYVSLLGLGLFGFVTSLERRLVFWHKSDPLEITSA